MKNNSSSILHTFLEKATWYSIPVLPVIYLVMVLLLHFNNGKFYLQFTDPEYFHLFNGLNLSIFNLAVDYIDHPGTTVQLLYAVSAHIVNLVLPGNDIISKAMQNPEEFIHAANLLLNIVGAISFYLIGFYTYKKTKNIFLAWLMQLTGFFSIRILLISARIIPESVLIVVLLCLILLIILYIYDTETRRNRKFFAVAFGIISGLGMATKFSYIPFLIVPLFLLNKKGRWYYIFYSIIFTAVFAFPVFVNIGKSWQWFGNMLMHSGKWGSGEANLIDIRLMPERLMALYNIDRGFFFILALGLSVLLLSFVIPQLKYATSIQLKRRALMGIISSIAISVFLITKHFAYHYYIPDLVFKSFILMLAASIMLSEANSQKLKKYISLTVFLIVVAFVIPQINPLRAAVKQKQGLSDKYEQREHLLKVFNEKENILIISPHYRGSPFKQSALAAGFMLSGQLRSTFKKKLNEDYPNTFLFVTWSDQFYCWDEFLDANEFIDPGKPVYVFIGEGNEKHFETIIDRIDNHFQAYNIQRELLYHFNDPEEFFYKLIFLTKELNGK